MREGEEGERRKEKKRKGEKCYSDVDPLGEDTHKHTALSLPVCLLPRLSLTFELLYAHIHVQQDWIKNITECLNAKNIHTQYSDVSGMEIYYTVVYHTKLFYTEKIT